MATQIFAPVQAQAVTAEALQQVFSICDSVADDLRNGAQIRSVPVSSVFPQGGQVVEVLKGRLEAIANVRFEIYTDIAAGTVLHPVTELMSLGSTVSSADPEVGPPVSTTVASPKKNADKTPRPKNAFMIYRLDYHARVAAERPGLHNNEISKIIGAQWRSETPQVVEQYKRRAEEEKRQHAISYPGYRYQPRKPSEKKKRMTKNKLAKLAALSGSNTTSTDTAPHVQGHNEVQNQTYNMPGGEQVGLDITAPPYEVCAPPSLPVNGQELDLSAFADPWQSHNIQFSQHGADASMMHQQNFTITGAAPALPADFANTFGFGFSGPAYFEQERQADLENNFTMDNLIDPSAYDNFLLDPSALIPDDFNPVENAHL